MLSTTSDEESFLRKNFNPKFLNTRTFDAFHNFFVKRDIKIDYLHIDAGGGNNDWGGRGAIGYDNSGTAVDGFKIYLTTSSTPNENFNGGAIYIYGYK